MQLRIDAVTKAPRVYQGKTQWGVKTADGKWYSLYQNDKPARGDVLEVAIEESQGNDGKIYYNAYPAQKTAAAIANLPPAPAQDAPPIPGVSSPQYSNGHGKISWSDFERTMREAHRLASELEPDYENGAVERGRARAALVGTIMIAYSNGRIAAPELDPWGAGPDA